MSVAPGQRVGGYRLDALLGEGAVGEVYRARDLKLERDVAVKILRPELAGDPQRLARFAREARAASALNHPNLVHIYDIGDRDGVPYIAMELVEGRTLRQILRDGPMAPAELFDVAAQLADGLAKAHAAGIVHRDLKPENLILGHDGYVKILDFGLAKLYRERTIEAGGESFATHDGVLLGTAAYMSPEQASGREVDHRSDVFSLGLVLYEMATGRPAFRGASLGETLAAVIRRQPVPIAELSPQVPEPFRRATGRCLAKDPAARWASSQDLAAELRTLREQSWSGAGTAAIMLPTAETAAAVAPDPGRRRWPLLLAAGALVLVALGVAWLRTAPPGTDAGGQGRLRLLTGTQAPQGRVFDPDLSPDGKMFVYVTEVDGMADLFVGRVAGGAHVRLTGDRALESHPDFSPNGEAIAFARVAPGAAVPEVCVTPALGGRVTTVIRAAGMPAWSPDGRRLAFIATAAGAPPALVTATAGGLDRRLLLRGDGDYPFLYSPAWSPDGATVAVRRSAGGVAGEIWLVPAAGGAARRLSDDLPGIFAHDPVFTPDGLAVVVSSNRSGATNLWRLPLDGSMPRALTSGPGPDLLPSIADDGTVSFLNTVWRYTVRLHHLASGETRELASHSAYLWSPAFSADGGAVIVSRAEMDGAWNLWRIAVDGGAPAQLTATAEGALYPRPLADGSVLFNTWSRPRRILRLPADGSPPVVLTASGADEAYADVSPDGGTIAFVRRHQGAEHVFLRPLAGGEERLLTPSPSTVPRFSPDGTAIAFSPDRGYTRGVLVIGVDGRGERRLTAEGGWPVWWPDGGSIGYLAPRPEDDSQQIRVVPRAGGAPRTIDGLRFTGTNHPFDIAPDGRRLVTSDSVPLTDQIWLLTPER